MNIFPKQRIVITGPESSGKTWLSEALSKHYNTIWTPEYARSYLDEINRPYEEADLLIIAQKQLELQNKDLKKAPNLLFCDTGLLVLKIWSAFKYGRTHPWINQELSADHYDLFLLCTPDLPWQYDPLREHPEERDILFKVYEDTLKALQLPYEIISGKGETRLHNAIKIVDTFLENNKPGP